MKRKRSKSDSVGSVKLTDAASILRDVEQHATACFESLGTSCATLRVHRSGALCGVATCDEDEMRWYTTLQALISAYDIDRSDDRFCNGEYNAVYFPEDGDGFPTITDECGDEVPHCQLVIRLTRPEVELRRYKQLSVMSREMAHTLIASANGVAPECFAAFLYAGAHTKAAERRDLHTLRAAHAQKDMDVRYGSFYVMRRMSADFDNVLQRIISKSHPQGARPPSVGDVATVALKPLIRMSALGMLHFDIKPANITVDQGFHGFIIDFDAFMCSCMKSDTRNDGVFVWEGHLLMHVALLLAHVRRFQPVQVADVWARSMRNILLELCEKTRSVGWLYAARASSRPFSEECADSPEAATRRFEAIVTCYFESSRNSRSQGAPFRLRKDSNAPPLISQLVRYGLTGSTTGADVLLSKALSGGCSLRPGQSRAPQEPCQRQSGAKEVVDKARSAHNRRGDD
jgi:hypothetical protein